MGHVAHSRARGEATAFPPIRPPPPLWSRTRERLRSGAQARRSGHPLSEISRNMVPPLTATREALYTALAVADLGCTPSPAPSPLCVRTSLAEQLAQVTPDVSNGCPSKSQPLCTIHLRQPVNDGLGAQQMRRLGAFFTALQLGCAYVHSPIAPMNANSRKHGVDHAEGECHFGLGLGCSASSSTTPLAPALPYPTGACPITFSGGAPWVNSLPANYTAAQAFSAMQRNSQTLRRRVAGRHMVCSFMVSDEAYTVPTLTDRCRYVRALASARARYLQANGGSIALPWFSLRSSTGLLPVHVAMHIRRKDRWSVSAREQAENDDKIAHYYTLLLHKLARLFRELNREWRRLDRPELVPEVHMDAHVPCAVCLCEWVGGAWAGGCVPLRHAVLPSGCTLTRTGAPRVRG